MQFPGMYSTITHLDACMYLLTVVRTPKAEKASTKVFVSLISGSFEMQQRAESPLSLPINKERKLCAAHSSRNSTQIISNQFVWLMPQLFQLFARACNKIRKPTNNQQLKLQKSCKGKNTCNIKLVY